MDRGCRRRPAAPGRPACTSSLVGSRRPVVATPRPSARAVSIAVPDGASTFWSWCSSMISAVSNHGAASSAKRIISTAPMAKLGAIDAVARGEQRRASSSRSSSVEAGGADDRVDPVLGAPAQVGAGRVELGEVDDHLDAGVEQRLGVGGDVEVGTATPVTLRRSIPAWWGSTAPARVEFRIVGHRAAHRAAHPPAGAEHPDTNRHRPSTLAATDGEYGVACARPASTLAGHPWRAMPATLTTRDLARRGRTPAAAGARRPRPRARGPGRPGRPQRLGQDHAAAGPRRAAPARRRPRPAGAPRRRRRLPPPGTGAPAGRDGGRHAGPPHGGGRGVGRPRRRHRGPRRRRPRRHRRLHPGARPVDGAGRRRPRRPHRRQPRRRRPDAACAPPAGGRAVRRPGGPRPARRAAPRAASTCSCSTSRPTTSTSTASTGWSGSCSGSSRRLVVVVARPRVPRAHASRRWPSIDAHGHTLTRYERRLESYLDERARARHARRRGLPDLRRRSATRCGNGPAPSAVVGPGRAGGQAVRGDRQVHPPLEQVQLRARGGQGQGHRPGAGPAQQGRQAVRGLGPAAADRRRRPQRRRRGPAGRGRRRPAGRGRRARLHARSGHAGGGLGRPGGGRGAQRLREVDVAGRPVRPAAAGGGRPLARAQRRGRRDQPGPRHVRAACPP